MYLGVMLQAGSARVLNPGSGPVQSMFRLYAKHWSGAEVVLKGPEVALKPASSPP